MLAVDEMRKDREHKQFQAYAQSFFHRWAPHDPYERAEFDAEFYGLVRQIYADAVAPMAAQMADMIKTMPLFIPKEK